MSDHQYGSHSSGGGGNLISDGKNTRPYETPLFERVTCVYTQAQVDALVKTETARCANVVLDYDDWPIDREQMAEIAALIMENK